MADPIKVLIVDDSRLFRSALEQSLLGHDDIKIVGSVFNGANALEFLPRSPPAPSPAPSAPSPPPTRSAPPTLPTPSSSSSTCPHASPAPVPTPAPASPEKPSSTQPTA